MKTITRTLLILSAALLPLLSACSSDPTGVSSARGGLQQDCALTDEQTNRERTDEWACNE